MMRRDDTTARRLVVATTAIAVPGRLRRRPRLLRGGSLRRPCGRHERSGDVVRRSRSRAGHRIGHHHPVARRPAPRTPVSLPPTSAAAPSCWCLAFTRRASPSRVSSTSRRKSLRPAIRSRPRNFPISRTQITRAHDGHDRRRRHLAGTTRGRERVVGPGSPTGPDGDQLRRRAVGGRGLTHGRSRGVGAVLRRSRRPASCPAIPVHRCPAERPDRPPHDYGVVIILLGVADKMVPADQVEPLRQGILAFLNASHLDMVDKPRAALEFERARKLSRKPARAGTRSCRG